MLKNVIHVDKHFVGSFNLIEVLHTRGAITGSQHVHVQESQIGMKTSCNIQ